MLLTQHHVSPDMVRSADLLYAFLCGRELADAGRRGTNTAFFDDPEAREQYELGLAGRQMDGGVNPALDKRLH